MELAKALDVSVAFPTLRTLRRPGKGDHDLLLTLSLGAQWQRHFFRITPLPPKNILIWSEDIGIIVDLGRGQFHTVCRHLARKQLMYVYPAGNTPTSLQSLDVAVLTHRRDAAKKVDLRQAFSITRS